MYNREIDVNNNTVFYAPEKGVQIDLSKLREQRIEFICEKDSEIWVERNPFNGRETDFDFNIAYHLFDEAEKIGIEEEKRVKEILDARINLVGPFAVSKAIYEKDYTSKYLEWRKSLGFVDQERLTYLSQWDRRSNFYQRMIKGLGLNTDEENKLFLLAKSMDK